MEKICSIKLISGEEIVCSVIEIIEGSSFTSVAIYNPVKIVLQQASRKSTADFTFKFCPWLIVDKSDLLEINLNKIITICEVTDTDILFEYKKLFQKKLNPKPTRQFKRELGFVGSVEDFRKTLEKLYKSDPHTKDT